MASLIERARAARAVSTPEEVAQVKAIACELPKEHGLPLSRFSRAELHRLVVERGVCEASGSTIARWLREDALKPWQYRAWIFPHDPDFLAKAGRVLDLYRGRFEGKLLHPGDCVVCAGEKPSIQARLHEHETVSPRSGSRGQHVEHRYERRGALTYLAALDIRRARVFGRSAPRGGIAPFDRLVHQVMTKQPYASAPRGFWIVDNGSSHRGQRSIERLERRAKPRPHPPAAARELAQPNRALLLDRPAQSARAERLRRRRRARAHAQRLRAPLEQRRRAVRLALYPRRPRAAD